MNQKSAQVTGLRIFYDLIVEISSFCPGDQVIGTGNDGKYIH